MVPGWADICLICSVLRSLICPPSLCLLELYQEAFKLRGEGIGIDHCRRQLVGQGLGRFPFVLGNATEAPVNRNANLEGLLAIDLHGTDAAGHHRFSNVVAPDAADLHPFASPNAPPIRKLAPNLPATPPP